jgi:hypothetical protein
MSVIDRLERAMPWLAVRNLPMILIAGQVIIWALQNFANYPMDAIALIPGLVIKGEVWRLFTFAFFPPEISPFFLIFKWLILYITGSALEREWGSFKFSLFIYAGLLFSWLVAGIALLISPMVFLPNYFIDVTIFLAFAFVFPNYEFFIMFILPVRVKWLAVITWAFITFNLLFAGLLMKLIILGGIGNFLVFFAGDLISMARNSGERAKGAAKRAAMQTPKDEAFHTCSVCGITDISHPDKNFFYSDGVCICEDCLKKQEVAQNTPE